MSLSQQIPRQLRSQLIRIPLAMVVGLIFAAASGLLALFLIDGLYGMLVPAKAGLESTIFGLFGGGMIGLVVGVLITAKMLAKTQPNVNPLRPTITPVSYNFNVALGVTVVALGIWFLTTTLLGVMSVNTHGGVGNLAVLVLSFFAADWYIRLWQVRADIKVLVAIVLYGIYTALFFTR